MSDKIPDPPSPPSDKALKTDEMSVKNISASTDADYSTIVKLPADQDEWWEKISPPEDMPKEAPWLNHADLEAVTGQREQNQHSDNWPETGRSNLSPLLRLGLMLLLGTAIIGGYIWLFRQI